MRTLGVGLILQGLLSASFNNFAGSVPEAFQGLAYGAIGGLPWSVLGLFALALVGAFVLRSTHFGAHLYATGGNPDGHIQIRKDLETGFDIGTQNSVWPEFLGNYAAAGVNGAELFGKTIGDHGILALPARNDDHVRPIQQFQPAAGHDGEAAMGAKRTGLYCGAGKAVPVCPHLRSLETEYFGGDTELECAKPVIEQGDNKRGLRFWHDVYAYCHLRQLQVWRW